MRWFYKETLFLLLLTGIMVSLSAQELVAHRGLSSQAPENTRIAISKAVEAGFKSIEIDVRATKDSYLVALHDETIDRTSNSTGKISQYNLEELNLMNFNYKKKFGNQFTFCKIPTINEILEIVKDNNLGLVLDLKQGDYIENLLQIIDQSGVDKQKISFLVYRPKQAKQIRKVNSQSQIYYVVFSSSSINEFFVAKLISNKVDGIALDNNYKEPSELSILEKMGLDILIWNISSPDKLNPGIQLQDHTKILVDIKMHFNKTIDAPKQDNLIEMTPTHSLGSLIYLNLGEVYFINPNEEIVINTKLYSLDGKQYISRYDSSLNVIFFDKNLNQILMLIIETNQNIYTLKFRNP